MSIIKVNQDGKSHLKIVRLSEFKVNNQTYTINVQGIRVNGATHWVTPLHSSSAMRVIIMANVTTSTTGYMFGDSRFAIIFIGGNIVWNYNGGQYTRAIEAGTHLFGFIDGKPYYDGSMPSPATVTASTSADVCYIGSANNPDPTRLNNASIIKVELYGHETNAADVKGTWSYYATRINGNGYLIEKWANILNAHVGTQPTAATKDDGSYDSTAWGISIDDLRQVVPTGFYDLTAIYTEDGGTVSGSYVEPEIFKGTINGTEVERRMAFRWRTDSGSTLPESFTKQDHKLDDVDGNVTGIHGELLLGRKPTWNIWADNVNMGRYIHGNTSGSDIRQAKIRFNPLKDKYGQDKPKGWRLDDWENYSPTLFHKPDLRVGGLSDELTNIIMEFVNGLAASTAKTYYISDNTNTSTTPRATPVINYTKMANLRGDITFTIGNLISWHEETSYYNGYDGNNNPEAIPIYGGYYAVRIGESYENNGHPLHGMLLMVGWDAEDTPLGSKSSIAIRDKYRSLGISVAPSLYNHADDTLQQIRAYAQQNGGTIDCYAEFGLLVTAKSNANGFTNGIPNFSAMVSSVLITPQKTVSTTIEEKTGYYTFVTGMTDELHLVCDSQGDAACLPVHTAQNVADEFVLAFIAEENGSYKAKSIEANLTLYVNGQEAEVIATKTSINKTNFNAASHDGYQAWLGETDHYPYRGGVRTNSSSINSNITTSQEVQFLRWSIDDFPEECCVASADGTHNKWKLKENISFKVDIVKVGEEEVAETISFIVYGITLYAPLNMTWRDWIGSQYDNSNLNFYILQDDYDGKYYVRCNTDGEQYYVQTADDKDVLRDDVITHQTYILSL